MKFLAVLLSSLSFLPSVVFAQTDIGNLIFRDILKMSSYPGSPFSGNIINDLVMFLFIPTVFIIVVIYTLAGRLTDNGKINLLLSLAFYLFIVFGGYYSIFALLAGPYFLFLIIIMGLFMFFLGHFGLRRAGTGGGGGGRTQGMPGRAVEAAIGHYENMDRPNLLLERDRIKAAIDDVDKQIKDAKSHNEPFVQDLRAQAVALQGELRLINHQIDIVGKATKRMRYF